MAIQVGDAIKIVRASDLGFQERELIVRAQTTETDDRQEYVYCLCPDGQLYAVQPIAYMYDPDTQYYVVRPKIDVAYERAVIVDEAWQNELDRVFKSDASNARYDDRGKSTPKLLDLYLAFRLAMESYAELRRQAE